jgi:hypothetical protein
LCWTLAALPSASSDRDRATTTATAMGKALRVLVPGWRLRDACIAGGRTGLRFEDQRTELVVLTRAEPPQRERKHLLDVRLDSEQLANVGHPSGRATFNTSAGVSRDQIEDALAVCFAFNTIGRLADAFGFSMPGPAAFETGAKCLLARGYR